jgi:cobalt-zinc-cadmium efflux system membrane fusion protein
MKNIVIIAWIPFLLLSCETGHKTETSGITQSASDNKVSLSEAQVQSANIVVGQPEQRNISTILKVNGTVDVPPQSAVSVSMPLGGYLTSTKLLAGMYIERGEIIATMEDQQYIQLQEDYLTAKTKLTFVDSEYRRQKELNESKSSSDKVLQLAEMELANQKIILRGLSEKLELIHIHPQNLTESNMSRSVNIYAPIDGFVLSVNVNIGKYVTPSDVLFELINPSDIHLNLRVFEKDIEKLSIGQKLMAYTINQPDKKYPCEIMLISQALSADRTAEVHCHFKNYDKVLLPGMYMNAEIEILSHNTAAVAEEAVVHFEGKNYLFISTQKNEFQMVEAETGLKENGFVEINNLQAFADQPIVTKGAYVLLMEMKNKSDE